MGQRSFTGVGESEFNMWRAVFAFSLADNRLSVEEQGMLHSYFANVPFSEAQIATLKTDFESPKNVEAMFKRITEKNHKERFCVLARALVWCEGDMDRQEATILQHVGCMKGTADEDMLHQSRFHPNLHDFYQQYAKAGMVGLMKAQPALQMHI